MNSLLCYILVLLLLFVVLCKKQKRNLTKTKPQEYHQSPFPSKLLDGYNYFVKHRLPTEQVRFRELATKGQQPHIMIISCCDSRVPPEVIFNAVPGELFVVRNIANLVPPYKPSESYHGVSAALEYAVQVLRVKHIVILGHEQCGGIRAACIGGPALSPGDFVGRWMSLLDPTLKRIKNDNETMTDDYNPGEKMEEFISKMEKEAIDDSLNNLLTFPCISALVNKQKLQLHGALFGVAAGSLFVRTTNKWARCY